MLLAQAWQMQRLVVAARLPAWCVASRLKIQFVITSTQRTCQKIQFYKAFSKRDTCEATLQDKLTSTVSAAGCGDNSVTFQAPCSRVGCCSQGQWLVGCSRIIDVQVCGRICRLD